MKRQISAIVTMEDIDLNFGDSEGGPYFEGNKNLWKKRELKNDSFYGEMEGSVNDEDAVLEISIRKSDMDPICNYKVWAVDDNGNKIEDDYKEDSTDDPIMGIKTFVSPIGKGKFSSLHELLSSFGKLYVSDKKLNAKRFIASTKRFIASTKTLAALLKQGKTENPKSELIKDDETEKLLKKIKSEASGWKTKITQETEKGETEKHPTSKIKIEIGDEFIAFIEIESLFYDYKFSIQGNSKHTSDGATDDPIREFDDWLEKL